MTRPPRKIMMFTGSHQVFATVRRPRPFVAADPPLVGSARSPAESRPNARRIVILVTARALP
ncbi:hypothetical protein GXW84_15650 [Rhodococcus sp. IEGM 248]|uniref:hypothetical protein n=1 Tax=Rhodococcus opacus TaxID=37919 RepID=UPI0013BFA319|nr:hypothetical protein [Rhodococcus opacus]NDV05949.1 hypothetical protein [Rhodococcus sp. IEGM 248]